MAGLAQLPAPMDAASVRAALNGPRVKVPVAKEVREIGCAVVSAGAGGVPDVAVVPRRLVAPLIGNIDSVAAPIMAGRPTHGSLQVVSAAVTPSGQSRTLTINCLVSQDISHGAFAELTARSQQNPLWSAIVPLLRPYSVGRAAPEWRLASQLLLAPIQNGLSPKQFKRHSGATRHAYLVPSAPRFSSGCGLDTGIACGEPTLPTVTITARRSYPTIVDWSDLYRARSIYSLSDILDIRHFYDPECDAWNAMYYAMHETMQRWEEEAAAMEVATNEVSGQICEVGLAQQYGELCLDLFIMAERAAFLIGDNRKFDPYAPYKASRAQIYVNPERCIANAIVNTTRTVQVGPFGGGLHEPHILNKIEYRWIETGVICEIKYELLTGWCRTWDQSAYTFLCPSIDGTMVLRKGLDGVWSGNVNEDKFPSRGLYWLTNAQFRMISERKETIWLDLFSWRKHIEDFRLSIPPCPDRCNLQ